MAAMLDFARTAPIDAAYLRHVVDRLASIGSSPLGFRATGTPEDRAVADFVAAEMRDMGLAEVAIEPVPVDGWRLLDASVGVRGRSRVPVRLDGRCAADASREACSPRSSTSAPASAGGSTGSTWPGGSRCSTGATPTARSPRSVSSSACAARSA